MLALLHVIQRYFQRTDFKNAYRVKQNSTCKAVYIKGV